MKRRNSQMQKQVNFKSMDSLNSIIKVINEAEEALNNKARVIADSAIPEVLAGAAGAVAGGALSFVALINLGSVVRSEERRVGKKC